MLDTLETEMILHVLSFLSSPGLVSIPRHRTSTLYALCLVSKRLKACAQPLLWQAVEFSASSPFHIVAKRMTRVQQNSRLSLAKTVNLVKRHVARFFNGPTAFASLHRLTTLGEHVRVLAVQQESGPADIVELLLLRLSSLEDVRLDWAESRTSLSVKALANPQSTLHPSPSLASS
jgi:hypothetical protein